jgi:hypothetical protein
MSEKATHGLWTKPWPAQLNKERYGKAEQSEKQPLTNLVLSIGQVVSLFCHAWRLGYWRLNSANYCTKAERSDAILGYLSFMGPA